MNRQYEAHTEKVKARQNLIQAIKKGKVIKPLKCSVCHQKKRLDGHHEDYKKPLQVIWMCRQCHRAYHKRQEFNKFRRALKKVIKQLETMK